MRTAFGVDIGGSGIKGAPVDVDAGQLLDERHKLATPTPSVPKAVAEAVLELVGHFGWSGPVGCAFPAIVKRGLILSAANVDPSWVGVDGEALFSDALGMPVTVLNDADAAGIAEMTFGAGKGRGGVVLLLTFGTGIGSALFADGVLVPNTEFGHLRFKGGPAEHFAAARVRKDRGLSWDEWADRVNEFLHYLESVASPDLFILGGGVSRRFEEFSSRIDVGTEVVPAAFENQAGIVGAAMAAADRSVAATPP